MNAPQKTASPALGTLKLSLVIFYVRDPMASLPFYRDLLGMKVTEASPEWVALDGGGVSLALHPHPAIPAKREATSPWVVFDVDDVRGAYEALVAKGATVHRPPEEGLRRRHVERALGRPPRSRREPDLDLREGRRPRLSSGQRPERSRSARSTRRTSTGPAASGVSLPS